MEHVDSPAVARERVLIVARSTAAHPHAGGMETSTDAVVDALHALGVKTGLLTTRAGREPLPAGYRGHDAIWELNTRRNGRYSVDWWRRARWRGPWSAWQPSIVFGAGDAAASFVRRPGDVSLVVHCHGTTTMEVRSALSGGGAPGLARAALNLARTPHRARYLRSADIVAAVGSGVAASLASWPFGVDPAHVVLLENSIDDRPFRFVTESREDVRASLGVPASVPLLLSAGRLAKDKGVDIAIEALRQLERARLVIAGDGPEMPHLSQLAVDLGVNDRVHFLGRRDRRELSGLMSAADQLVFPTRRREGAPMILLEAAANGLPVVTTDHAQVPADLMAHVVLAPATSTGVADAVAQNLMVARSGDSYLPERFQVHTLPQRLLRVVSDARRNLR
jgi:glycosyltransferase involved in cell wall biosynthesis